MGAAVGSSLCVWSFADWPTILCPSLRLSRSVLARPAPQVLEEACSVLKIVDPSSVKLVVEKGEKHIDHSLTLRQANVKAANKLALVKSDSHARTRASEPHAHRVGVRWSG